MYKPYQLVTVDAGTYRHYGETISLPTPCGTIMVRAVPGDPTTMIEVPVDKVALVGGRRRTWYVHYASVRGMGSFPWDMLRYDYAAPVGFKVTEEYPYHDQPKGSELIVGRLSENHRQPWTYARWSSFLWGCKHLRTETFTVGELRA